MNWKTLVKLSVLFATFSTILSAQGTTESALHKSVLNDSGRRVVYDAQAFSGRSSTLPEWHHGFLVSWDVETFKEGQSNVALFDQNGNKLTQTTIWFPDSTRIVVDGAAATSDGRIVAVGEANKIDGTTGHFVAITDKTGKVTQVIQTQNFYPGKVCVAPDETIWSFGSTGFTKSVPKPGNTLLHFDINKGLIGSYVPRSVFPDRVIPDMLSHMECSANEVAVYSSTASKYIVMKYGGETPMVYDVANAPANVKMIGFASPNHGQVYGLFNKLGTYGLYSLQIDEAHAKVSWTPVDNTTEVVGLWGSDSDSLVVSTNEDGGGLTALHWAKVTN